MGIELVSMSRKEIDRLDVIRRVVERRLTQVKAAQLVGLRLRQVGRMCAAYERHGPSGLVSRQRRKARNRRLPEALQVRAQKLVREHYSDFGPTLAEEKLRELHGVELRLRGISNMDDGNAFLPEFMADSADSNATEWDLRNGDCVDGMGALPDATVDVVITDPPSEAEARASGSS